MRSATAFTPQHVERLAAYWAEALGGPSTYSESYGDETTFVKMHSGNGKHDEIRPRQRCPATTSPPMMCLTASASHTGQGADSRCKTPQLTYTTSVVSQTSNLLGDFVLTQAIVAGAPKLAHLAFWTGR